jgi:hypothetical protein
MRPSVIQLRQFYTSRLGRAVKKRLRERVHAMWPSLHDEVVLGIGYAPPLLRALDREPSVHVLALMPADQGAVYWPVHTDNRSVLGDELMPPLASNSLQRVLVVHALEFLARPDELLRVYWEMLAPGGRLLLVVPNRRGLWSKLGATPFARGTPYSMAQLKELVAGAQFTLRDASTALYARGASPLVEWLGRLLLPGLGGVILLEAEKQIYAGVTVPVQPRRARWNAAAVPVGEHRSAS